MDDREIIALFQSRNEAAIHETEAKYGHLCLSLAQHILGNREDAEECVSDAFLALWNQIPPEDPAHFSAYLCKIVNNLALKRYAWNHAEKRSPGTLLSLDELEEVLSDESLKDTVEAKELGEALNRFLDLQKEETRQILVLRYWFDLPVKVIAERLRISESKVLTLLCRSRRKLKSFLKKEGISL